jgi:hypothetical protein
VKQTKSEITVSRASHVTVMSDRISPEVLETIDQELGQLEENKAEALAELNKAKKLAIHEYKLHKAALDLVRKYMSEDPAKASAFYQSFTHYWRLANLPEGDMFGSVQ